MTDQGRLKRIAALRAVEDVKDGTVVGLGTGSTVAPALEAIARKVQEGCRAENLKAVVGVVEHGLFLGLAPVVIVGTRDGVVIHPSKRDAVAERSLR